ncbi:MAG: TolC family protein [Halanaerobiales bacterium]
MKKRFTLLPLILITVLFFSPTLLAESIELNLEEAYQITLEDNISLKIAQKDLENKEIQYQKSKAENLLNQSNYSELQAEYNLATAKKSYINTANNLLQETLQQYTDILLKDKDIETLNKQIILNENLLSEVKAQYEVGEKSQLDILEQEIELNDLIQQREQLKNEYEQLKTEFKLKLGIDKDLDLQLIELTEPKYLNLEEKEIYERAFNNSWKLKINRLNLELTETDQKKKEVVSSSEMDKDVSDNKVKIAELELDQQKQDIGNKARELSNQISNIRNNIKLHKDKIQSARETYEILEEQNKSGLITDNELYEGEISLLQSEYQLYNSYMQYYIQAQGIKQFMNPGAGVLVDEE